MVDKRYGEWDIYCKTKKVSVFIGLFVSILINQKQQRLLRKGRISIQGGGFVDWFGIVEFGMCESTK